MPGKPIQETLSRNLARIRDAIDRRCRSAGRDPREVRLLPATKYASVEIMEALLELGVTEFGENQVKHAEEKAARLGDRAVFHLIGHLQRNKVKRALRLFRSIQSLDSVRLAEEISKRSGASTIPVLVEVNVAEESRKYGFAPSEVFEALRTIDSLPGLRVEGFMTVAPYTEDPESVRPYFRRLREIRDEARRLGLGDGKLDVLSMGMSNDFPVAVEEGATVIRVGSLLFEGVSDLLS